MKHLYKLLTIAFILLGPSIIKAQTATAPASGDGSAGNPYKIATLENLYWIAEDNTRWGYNYQQTADIDASETSTWNSGSGWAPIGNSTVKFTGNYDGNDYKIVELFINRPASQYQGLFGIIDNASISYLTIEEIQITAPNYVGGIAGQANNGSTVYGCHVKGSIIGSQNVGGITGSTNSSTIEACSAEVSVKGRSSVGGIVGSNLTSSTVVYCYSKGTITATSTEETSGFGGLVGFNIATIAGCFSNCNVISGMESGGGLVGYNSGYLNGCYSTGNTSLLGSGSYIGGLIGYNSGTVISSYWDIEASGNPTSAAGTGKTTSEMKMQSTFELWDFEMLPEWQISSRYYYGYPYLGWMPTTAEPMVSTSTVGNITGTSAGATGELIGLGFTDPSQHGFCWSTSQNPTIADSKIELGSVAELKSFTSPIEGLSLNTTYYLRAYATNGHGTSYGEEITFTTLPFNGAGTDVDPYQIENLNQLRLISENTGYWDKHYIQIADIDASETSTWNGGEGWSPIGNATVMFTGSYNGQSFSISNLYINRPTQENVGFFGRTFNTTIQNIKITNADISGLSRVGVFSGSTSSTTLLNIHCTGQLTSTGDFAGGLAGYVSSRTVTNCSSNVTISGNNSVGGLIGYLNNNTVSNCYSNSPINATGNYVGGFVGNNNGTINNCYATGSVSGDIYVGGFVGNNQKSITNSYCNNNVTGNGFGSFAYGNSATVSNSFYDYNINGDYSYFATGVATSQLKNLTTFIDATWDFKGIGTEGVWNIGNSRNNGYPYLNWEYPTDKAPQIITFGSLSAKTYGDADFDLTATASSGLDVSYTSSNENVATISGTTLTIVGAGTVNITASQAGNESYNAASNVVRSLTVSKKALTIKADNKAKTYDGNTFSDFTVTYNGFVNGEDETALDGSLYFEGDATTAVDADYYYIYPKGLTSNNYAITFQNGFLEINSAPLTITADNKTKTYDGNTYSDFSVTYSGFVNGEDETVLFGTLSYTGTAISAINANTYTITPQGLSSSNYNISFVSGTLEINRAPLTVTAENKTKTYDGSAYTAFTSTYSGFVNSEDATVLGGELAYTGAATTATNAGTYTITPTGVTSSNYEIAFVNGSLEIGKAALTVTAENKTKTYDGSAFTAFTSTYSGFVNSEDATVLGGALTHTGAATTATNAGTYTITPMGVTSSNYEISIVNGSLEIGKAALTVTADDKAKTYDGSAFTAFTSTYSGFVNSEDETALGGSLTYTGTAATATNAGTYTITPQGVTSDNYEISFVNGSLEIGRAPLTITAENKTKIYDGSAFTTFTSTFSGFVNGEDATVLGGILVYTGDAATATNAGTYTITPTGVTSSNYEIAFVNGSLEIGKAPLTVTADNKAKIYDGSAFTAFTSTFSGFVNSEDASVLSGTLAYTGDAATATNAGTYTIIPMGFTSDNYEITFVNGSLEIGKAALTVTAENKTKNEGEENPMFTFTYSGFIGNDTANDIDEQPTVSTTATADSPAGEYPITLEGGVDNNYALTLVNGTLTVVEITHTITFTVTSKENPVANAIIQIDGIELTTDANGLASINLPNGNYTYTVTASGYVTYEDNLTVANTDASISINLSTVGIESPTVVQVQAYPNPFTNSLTIQSNMAIKWIRIMDTTGQTVASQSQINSNSLYLLTDHLKQGIYIITINTGTHTKTLKVVKQ